jgi:hypothetical protein
MIYDLMPLWLRRLLDLDSATLPTERWTWRHVCRYGGDPGKLADDIARYEGREKELRRIFNRNRIIAAIMCALCLALIAMQLWWRR